MLKIETCSGNRDAADILCCGIADYGMHCGVGVTRDIRFVAWKWETLLNRENRQTLVLKDD
jgi:hypothetical protein